MGARSGGWLWGRFVPPTPCRWVWGRGRGFGVGGGVSVYAGRRSIRCDFGRARRRVPSRVVQALADGLSLSSAVRSRPVGAAPLGSAAVLGRRPPDFPNGCHGNAPQAKPTTVSIDTTGTGRQTATIKSGIALRAACPLPPDLCRPPFVSHPLSPTLFRPLFVARPLSTTFFRLLFVAHPLPPILCRPPFVVRPLSPGLWWPPFVVHPLAPGLWRPGFGGRLRPRGAFSVWLRKIRTLGRRGTALPARQILGARDGDRQGVPAFTRGVRWMIPRSFVPRCRR